MKKTIITLLIVIVSFTSYAQIKFEKGYFINNTNEKITCLIKNIDWKNNPTQFKYKLSENEEPNIGTINNVKEFGVDGYSKYVRYEVEMDRSSSDYREMSRDRNPIFKTEILFLEEIINGDASLYMYYGKNIKRYFIKLKKSEIEQLVYKKFLVKDVLGENNKFKQQLFDKLKCENISLKDIKNVSYAKKDLSRLLNKYNKCKNPLYKNINKKIKRDAFNVLIRFGIRNSSLTLSNGFSSTRDVDFGSQTSLIYGIDVEYIFPFNKNKWTLFIAPTYQQFNNDKGKTVDGIDNSITNRTVGVEYKSIDIPIGIRHYLFLGDNSKIFISGALELSYSFNSQIKDDLLSDLDIRTLKNYNLGLGYKYKNRFSIEINYGFNRDILEDYIVWSSGYKSASMILGYTIF